MSNGSDQTDGTATDGRPKVEYFVPLDIIATGDGPEPTGDDPDPTRVILIPRDPHNPEGPSAA